MYHRQTFYYDSHFFWVENWNIQEISEWEVIEPLPSYGHGRDTAGGRYISLIFGTNLTDVVVTGKSISTLMHIHINLYLHNWVINLMKWDVGLANLISGENGTIDGQGALWWQQFHKKKLKYTRPYLIEIMHSDNIQISDLTFLNSPSWNVHPVYSR